VHQVSRGVLGVGVDVDTGSAAGTGALQGAKYGGQCGGVGRIIDGGQLVQQWLDTEDCYRLLVHEARVQVADAFARRCRWRTPPRCLDVAAASDDQVADLFLGAVEQRPERAVGGTVAGIS